MARVTIEDCLKEVDNTYDICCVASKRARDISEGAEKLIDSKNKPTVVALREIAASKIGLDYTDLSNKQAAETKLFGGITESEVINELSQHIESSSVTESNLTVTDSSITEPSSASDDQVTDNTITETAGLGTDDINVSELEIPSEPDK